MKTKIPGALPLRHSHHPSVILASRRESRLAFASPSPSVILAPSPVRHSRQQAGIQAGVRDEELDSRARPENDGGEKDTHGKDNDGLDSRGCPENDGRRKTRVILATLPLRHSHHPSPSVILASRRESRLAFSPPPQPPSHSTNTATSTIRILNLP